MPETTSQEADSQGPDSQPPVKKPRKPRKPPQIRYKNLTLLSPIQVPACPDCGASRHSVGHGNPGNSTVFTAHSNTCPIIRRVYFTPERLEDYIVRREEFLTHYSERIVSRNH